MKYEVTYLTVRGRLVDTFSTLDEAKDWTSRLKKLNKEPGHFAGAIKINKLQLL